MDPTKFAENSIFPLRPLILLAGVFLHHNLQNNNSPTQMQENERCL